MIWLLAHPLSRQEHRPVIHRKTEKERQLADGRGEEGEEREVESYDRKKAWSSINKSFNTHCAPLSQIHR